MWTSLAPVLVFVCCLVVFSERAAAQTPSPEDTLTAFSAVQRAVRAWGVIPETEKLPTPAGACVMLKLRGEVVGRGTAWAVGGGEQPKGGVIREALAAAMKQAEPRLGVSNDAMRDDAIKEVARTILIGVELAGPLSAIEPGTWEDAESSLRPGLDGVAVRAGDGKGAVVAVFPSQLMLTNTLPHRALGGAVAQSLGEGGAAAALDEPKRVREKQGLRMYSFRVGHAAQASPTDSPSLLWRGQRLVPMASPITTITLREMGKGMAEHLVRQPAANLSLDSLALRRIALREFGTLKLMDDEGVSERAASADRAEIQKRVAAMDHQKAPLSTLALAAIADPFPPSQTGLELLKAQTWQRISKAEPTLAERGPRALATTRLARWGMESATCGNAAMADEERIVSTIQDAFSKVPAPQLVATMPWLGWAAAENPVIGVENQWVPVADKKEGEILGAVALRHMRDQCWKHQITPTQATDDTLDMIGGIVFTAGVGEGGANPYPTWQCVRPLAFIATMLGDPRLTEPGERMKEIPNLMLAMRYLRQLQVDDASAWMYPNPELAKGGIRAAVWDNSQPTDATSLTLLCVIELLKSLDKLAAQQPPQAPAPATK